MDRTASDTNIFCSRNGIAADPQKRLAQVLHEERTSHHSPLRTVSSSRGDNVTGTAPNLHVRHRSSNPRNRCP